MRAWAIVSSSGKLLQALPCSLNLESFARFYDARILESDGRRYLVLSSWRFDNGMYQFREPFAGLDEIRPIDANDATFRRHDDTEFWYPIEMRTI